MNESDDEANQIWIGYDLPTKSYENPIHESTNGSIEKNMFNYFRSNYSLEPPIQGVLKFVHQKGN